MIFQQIFYRRDFFFTVWVVPLLVSNEGAAFFFVADFFQRVRIRIFNNGELKLLLAPKGNGGEEKANEQRKAHGHPPFVDCT